MGKYFGTDGFRGEANVVLTVEHAFKVGRYLGWYLGHEHNARIVIGKDTRRSSYMFEYALAAGRTDGIRGGRVSAPCNYHTQRILCSKDRGFRLRHYDLCKP